MTSSRQSLTVLGSVLVLAVCSDQGPDGPATIRGPAILVHYGDTTTVTMPTSARVGVPMSMTVTSFGGGCITQGETELMLRGLEAEVRPYRYETVRLPANTVCTDELRIFEHPVSLEFTEPGDGRVRVLGIQRPGDTPYIVERELTVLP